MSTKIKLGSRPKTFAPITINVTMPDGTDGCMEIVAKYFTRTEFGKVVDSLVAAAKEKAAKEDVDGDEAVEFSMAELMEKTRDQNADYLLKVLDSWNLDEELNRDSLEQLADECPAAAIAIMTAVRAAATEGRLGN